MNWARYLNSLLDPVLKYFSRYIVKDSFKFIDDLKLQGAKDTFLCSFDVKSLFTSVPLNEVIDICADTLYKLENPTLKSNFIRLQQKKLNLALIIYYTVKLMVLPWVPY